MGKQPNGSREVISYVRGARWRFLGRCGKGLFLKTEQWVGYVGGKLAKMLQAPKQLLYRSQYTHLRRLYRILHTYLMSDIVRSEEKLRPLGFIIVLPDKGQPAKKKGIRKRPMPSADLITPLV